MQMRRTALLTAAAAVATMAILGLGGRAPAAQASGVCPYLDSSGCAAPVNVTNAVSGHDVHLSWAFPSYGDTPYAQAIKRGPNGFQMSVVKYFSSGAVQTSFTDTNVPNGTWYYQVCSVYWDGEADGEYDACVFANPQGVTVGSPTVPPPAHGGGSSGGGTPPVSLSSPRDVTVTNITQVGALVSWNLPAGPLPGLQILCDEGYYLDGSLTGVDLYTTGTNACNFPNSGSAGFWTLKSETNGQTGVAAWNLAGGPVPHAFQFSSLTPGHRFNVSVCNTTGTSQACSNSVSFTTLPPSLLATLLLRPAPVAPSNLRFVGQTGDTSATIAFDSGSGGDEIVVDCTDLTTNTPCTPYPVAADVTSAALSGLKDDHDYRVTLSQVQLSDDASPPSVSDPLVLHIVRLSPPLPTDLHITDQTTTSRTLRWTSHADEVKDIIETDVYRDGVKVVVPSTTALSAASVQRGAIPSVTTSRSLFVDSSPSPSDPRVTTQYMVCNVYRAYRGTADERLRTSCSAPLVVSNFTLDPNAPVKPSRSIPSPLS